MTPVEEVHQDRPASPAFPLPCRPVFCPRAISFSDPFPVWDRPCWYLAKHPTTGNAIASPYVSMSRDYKKQVNADWFQIYQIVRENCSVEYDGASPQDDLMERLLRARNRK